MFLTSKEEDSLHIPSCVLRKSEFPKSSNFSELQFHSSELSWRRVPESQFHITFKIKSTSFLFNHFKPVWSTGKSSSATLPRAYIFFRRRVGVNIPPWDVGCSQPALRHDVIQIQTQKILGETLKKDKVEIGIRLIDFSESEVGNFWV